MPQIPAARPFFILAIDLCISASDGESHEIVVDGVALDAASISSLDIGASWRFNRLV